MSSDTPPLTPAQMTRYYETAVANLRHLYDHMVNGNASDTGEAARGLLGPAIKCLEPILDVIRARDAQCAAMRDALENAYPWFKERDGNALCIDPSPLAKKKSVPHVEMRKLIHVALASDAGAPLLAELERLRQQVKALCGDRYHDDALMKAEAQRDSARAELATARQERDAAQARFCVLWSFLKWVRSRDWTLDKLDERARELDLEGPAEIGINVVNELATARADLERVRGLCDENGKVADEALARVQELEQERDRAQGDAATARAELEQARAACREMPRQCRELGHHQGVAGFCVACNPHKTPAERLDAVLAELQLCQKQLAADGGGHLSATYSPVKAARQRIAELEQQLAASKAATIDAVNGKETSWRAVWEKLVSVGLLGFIGGDGTGLGRALEFIDYKAKRVTYLEQQLAAAEQQATASGAVEARLRGILASLVEFHGCENESVNGKCLDCDRATAALSLIPSAAASRVTKLEAVATAALKVRQHFMDSAWNGEDQWPKHGHSRIGIWDSNNKPGKADKPCIECSDWFELRDALAALDAPADGEKAATCTRPGPRGREEMCKCGHELWRHAYETTCGFCGCNQFTALADGEKELG